jgi:hypothetical protein
LREVNKYYQEVGNSFLKASFDYSTNQNNSADMLLSNEESPCVLGDFWDNFLIHSKSPENPVFQTILDFVVQKLQ